MPAVPSSYYSAFISYSSADRQLALRLHTRLEHYRFPPGAKTDEGNSPERLRPVFLDRLELRTGASLSETIQSALLESKSLVVLCSPRARISKWVNREIREFSIVNKDRRVFAFIVEGNPSADLTDETGCFPAALFNYSSVTSNDSLASDARTNGDGWKLAILKLIAGLANVPTDDLVRRDQQRAIRQLRWLVAGSLAIALAFAGLGTALYFQRKEAFRQRDLARYVRDRAQEMNTFFITDLRTKLRGIGRLDLLDATTQRVLDYQQALPPELANDAAVLRARAIAMDYVGQMSTVRGHSADAVLRLTESHAAWQALVNKNPFDVAAWQGLIVSSRILGEALETAGRTGDALQTYKNATDSLSTLRPTMPQGLALYKRLRSLLLAARGEAQYRLGHHEAASHDLTEAASCAKDAVEAIPTDRSNWQQAVDAFCALADHYRRIDDLQAALSQGQKAVEVGKALVNQDVENVDGWITLANAEGVLLMIQTATKQWDNSEGTAQDQLDLRQKVFDRDRQNPTSESKLGTAHDDLAFALAHNHKRQASIEHFSSAAQIFLRLTSLYPSREIWLRELALVLKRQGDLAFEIEAWDLALPDYESSLKLRQRLANYTPEDVVAQSELANIQIAYGEVLWKLKNFGGAEKSFREALATLRSPNLPASQPEISKLLESAERALGDLQKQEAGSTK